MTNIKKIRTAVTMIAAGFLGFSATASAAFVADCSGSDHSYQTDILCQSSSSSGTWSIQKAEFHKQLKITTSGSIVVQGKGLTAFGSPLQGCSAVLSGNQSVTLTDCDGLEKHKLITNL